MNFILDVNSDTPSLGFKPSEIKQGTTTENSGVNIDGTGYRFLDESGKTLAELGAKDGSLIVISEPASSLEIVNSQKPPTPTVVPKPPKRKVRSKLKKITRPSLKKKPPRMIKKIDPYNMNHLELMKTAALNEIAIGTTVNSIQQLKSHLNQLIQTGKKIRLSLPKKWRKKTYVTPIGEIKYSNILLWCDGTDDLDLSTMHLQAACVELFGDTVENPDVVGEKVFRLVNTRCSEPECNGTFRLWNLKDNPPKFI